MSGRAVRAYAALGDSFTAGRDSIDAERWADLLAAGMRRVNPDLVYENLAVDGATSAEVLERQVEPGRRDRYGRAPVRWRTTASDRES